MAGTIVTANIGDGLLVSRDFRVWLSVVKAGGSVWDGSDLSTSTLQTYFNNIKTTGATQLNNIVKLTEGTETGGGFIWFEFGELKKDGFVSNLDDGETVEGNTKGELLISQSGSLNLTSISISKAQLTELGLSDGDDICVMAVSEDSDTHMGFFYPNLRLNYNPALTGGEVGTIEVTFNKDVACGSDWNTVFTVA